MKDCLFYIPGFGSSSNSDKGRAISDLCAALDWKFVALDYPSSYDPNVIHDHFVDLVKSHQYFNAIFFGTSLGGFWANVLAKKFAGRALMVNPSMTPWTTLHSYVTDSGIVVSFDQSLKDLTAPMVDSYIYFSGIDINVNGNVVILCQDDDILDHRIALGMFSGHSKIVLMQSGGHRADGALNTIIDEMRFMMNREYSQ